MSTTDIRTLGQLKEAGYQPRSIRDEMRANLVQAIRDRRNVFEGIIGYDHTVLPQVQRALLSRHDILFLGLRGQAKTRMARMMTALLDEYVPVIDGAELHDDPLHPITVSGKTLVAEMGDDTPVTWLHRSERYVEKLATPDVTVADLIGDVDPIKAVNEKLSFSDERVIQYGLIPRSNRCLFVLNELPDLQPRIQVGLFNILQEGDVQIRGFTVRLPLDVGFVFTANPEDYTNRGSIVTPLKDRIGSQILTHYPNSLRESKAITAQEADAGGREHIEVPELARDLLEQVAIEARTSELVDEKSGVSARLTISAFENLLSAAERRLLLNGEDGGTVQMGDVHGIVPALTGKIELVYEGEQEGPRMVAQQLISRAIRTQFEQHLPVPNERTSDDGPDPYAEVTDFFAGGVVLELLDDDSAARIRELLDTVPGLSELAQRHFGDDWTDFHRAFILHGLAEHSLIGKTEMIGSTGFRDLLGGMFSGVGDEDDLG